MLLGCAREAPRMGAIPPRLPCGWSHRCLRERHRREKLYAWPADPSPVERWEELAVRVDQKDNDTSTLSRMTDITGSTSHSIAPFSVSRQAFWERWQDNRHIVLVLLAYFALNLVPFTYRHTLHLLLTFFAQCLVAYLRAADNVSGPLASCLRSVNQPVIRPQNAFSALLPSLLAGSRTRRLRIFFRGLSQAVCIV
jgi:hypothetical protein